MSARATDDSRQLPSGVVTFVMTDIEGSTGLFRALGEQYVEVLSAHNSILRTVVGARGGAEVGTEGDSLLAAFEDPSEALRGCLEMQQSLAQHDWPSGVELRVRIGVHTGEATPAGGDYVALPLHQVARIASGAHGGQVLVSETTAERVEDRLPPDSKLVDLGRFRLRGFPSPQRLFQLRHPDLLEDFPPLRSIGVVPNNLPTDRSTLVGRVSEIQELIGIVENSRIVTLTGAGGVGKTRLAQAVGRRLLDNFADGVWFLDLAPLSDGDLVMKNLASILDVEPPVLRPIEEVLVEAIGERRMLLVFDNCEHLVEAAATAVDSLLQAPNVKVLATSRETLRVEGEISWRVPSLSTPSPDGPTTQIFENEAVRLFAERATARDPTFRLHPGNAAAVASLCRHLDGIPLAIELAAARITTFTVEELAGHLDDRFSLLSGGSRTALPRHRTLEAAIVWSYDLLENSEQLLFARLGLLAGPFDMEAAIHISPLGEAETIDVINGLTSKSLLIPERHETGRRFQMLETLRQFGRSQLQQQSILEEARDDLLSWAHHMAKGLSPKLMSPDQVEAVANLDLDINSIRSALNWALTSGQHDTGLDVAVAVSRYWYLRALSAEGAQWYDRFLSEQDSLSEPTLIRGLIASSATLVRVGRWVESFQRAGQALELLDGSEDHGLLGWAYYERGIASFDLVDIRETRDLFLKAQQHFRESGSAIGAGLAVLMQNVAWLKIDPEEALKRSVALTEQMEAAGVPVGIAHSTEVVGVAALNIGNLDLAVRQYRQALPIYDELRIYACQAHCLDGVAILLIASGQNRQAAVVAAGTDELRKSLATVQAPYENLFEELEAFREEMDEENPTAVESGRVMSREEVVDFATDALRSLE